MKRKYYRFSCIMLIFILVLSNIKTVLAIEQEQKVRLDFVVPENVQPPTSYEEVTQRILAWQEIIPDGTIWNEHTPYGDEGYLGEYYEWTAWNGNILRATACSAFSYVISNGVFGSNAPVTLNTKVKFEDIRPGDVLTINNAEHCVIVVQVHKEYDCIRIAEGNSNGVVNWNSVLSKKYIMERIDCLETRYPDGFVDGQNTTVSTATSAPATHTPVTPTATPAPATHTPIAPPAPSVPDYKYSRIEKPYTYLYDSNNDEVDMFMLKSGSLTYKGEKLPFKPIKWADFNESAHIIVVQKNSVYYSVKSTINGVKIKKLGKGAKKRQKKNGLIITIATKNGKKINVANL